MTTGQPTSAEDIDRFIRELFAAVDSRDTDRLSPFLAEDVTLQFGSSETISGKPEFLASNREFSVSIADIEHQIMNLWYPEQDIVVVVLRVTYRRLDGVVLTLPCCNIFRLQDGLISDYRVYMDITPVYA